jgi:hypothetical protein
MLVSVGAVASADTLAKRAEAARQKGVRDQAQYDADLRKAQLDYLQQQVDLAGDGAKRADLERQRVRFAEEQYAKEIAAQGPVSAGGTGKYTADEVATLQRLNHETAGLRVQSIDHAQTLTGAADLRSIDDANVELRKQELEAQEGLADTLAQRRKIAQDLLELEFQQRRKALETARDDKSATPAQRQIARNQLAALPGQKALAQQNIDRQNQGVGRAYADSFGHDPQQILEGTEVKIIQDFNGELDKTVSKALNLHGIFGEIVDDLIQMAIKQALIAPIANTIFPASGSTSTGGSGGFFSSLISNIGSAFGGGSSRAASSLTSFVAQANDDLAGSFLSGARANGGPVDAGGTYLVGERGPELLRMGSQGGNIVPNHALATVNPNMRASAPQVAGPTINQTIRYSGAVDIADKSYVQQMGAALYAHTEQAVTQGSQQTLAATPGYMQRNTQLK